ncbi:MAG: DUF429 domain-containing protein, partial [Acidobacteria bacterium]|nr:DUF429 domain-containing protein [Acidobacteriota bacterium]
AGMSRQAFNIMRKIREVDKLLQPNFQDHVFEAHPEIAFARVGPRVPELAGGAWQEGRGGQ